MHGAVKVLFASGSEAVIKLALARLRGIFPELPLVVVSEFPAPEGEWIPYHIRRSWTENYDLVRARLAQRSIRIAAVILEPRVPYWNLRALGFAMAPLRFLAFNELGEHFMLRPRSVPTIARHILWRGKNLIRSQFRKGGKLFRLNQMLRDPRERELSVLFRRALKRGRMIAQSRREAESSAVPAARPRGISVVIPTREGGDLVLSCLEKLEGPSKVEHYEIIVVDNGSREGAMDRVRKGYPDVIFEHSAEPLSFARAVNRGITRARYSHVCLLNNDMLVEPGFLDALYEPFDSVPDLFASTAQIFLPEGQRREETGITILPRTHEIEDFPIRCEIPLEGEDQSYVLYGSGGCTLYDAAKLAALGGFDEVYAPAYVEDLDVGVRGWLRGWPTVYCAGAQALHLHRTTTKKYFSAEELEHALELNFVRLLARAIPDAAMFERMWDANVLRLKVLGKVEDLRAASVLPIANVSRGDSAFFALVNGEVSVFPGKARTGKPVVMVVSPYLPFPLSHGAAVRVYNLMRREAPDFDQVLVAFSEDRAPVPRELLDICVEVVVVRRPGTHAPPASERPETVEEFDSASLHEALRMTTRKWKPRIAQFEFTQMVQYAGDCAGAKTILVEHDITYDLYAQMLARKEDWEAQRQYDRWLTFERAAWKQVDCVVTMSEKDRAIVGSGAAIANGVDLERFQPSMEPPEPRRLLFIGSFAHKPNVLALEFFLRDVFPSLRDVTLHVIAGQRHQRFWDLQQTGVELEGFVSDVRSAYRRATVVIAPLVASAGTNIKIMEAMAMGKAIVSTEAGIHGLELNRGSDVIVTNSAAEMAAAINRLLDDPVSRVKLEKTARATAERLYDWNVIAAQQKKLYESLL